MSIFKKQSDSNESLENGKVLVDMYGGRDNIEVVDCCLTRLRIKVKDVTKVDQEALMDFGSRGVVINDNATQVIFGDKSEEYKKDIEAYLSVDYSPENGKVLVNMYGGRDNIEVVDCCRTRLRIKVKDVTKVDQEALMDFGGKAIVVFDNATQVIFGERTEEYKKDIDSFLKNL